jgi:CheY-like chemotaxis protein
MKRVLVVEDDKINAFIIKKFLSADYDVIIMQESNDVLNSAEKGESYDAVLMDINLGEDDIDGTELLHKIKEFDQFANTPVIATTAYAMSGDRKRFIDEGFTDYLAKPISKPELTNMLESVT